MQTDIFRALIAWHAIQKNLRLEVCKLEIEETTILSAVEGDETFVFFWETKICA